MRAKPEWWKENRAWMNYARWISFIAYPDTQDELRDREPLDIHWDMDFPTNAASQWRLFEQISPSREDSSSAPIWYGAQAVPRGTLNSQRKPNAQEQAHQDELEDLRQASQTRRQAQGN